MIENYFDLHGNSLKKEKTPDGSKVVSHYCKVITALAQTIKLQEGLDELFKEVEKDTLSF